MTDAQKELLGRLIKTYSGGSTESLIAQVAGTEGLLDACRSFLETVDGANDTVRHWLRQRCERAGIDEGAFIIEVHRIIEIFSPHSGDDEPHAILGVSQNADLEEIKRAYRRLSLKYHPDTAAPEYRERPEDFIRITRAYNALLGERPRETSPPRPCTRVQKWRRQKKRSISTAQRKQVFAWSIGLVAMLLVVSLIAANNYRERTMLAGLQRSQGAFIPPARRNAPETGITSPVSVKRDNAFAAHPDDPPQAADHTKKPGSTTGRPRQESPAHPITAHPDTTPKSVVTVEPVADKPVVINVVARQKKKIANSQSKTARVEQQKEPTELPITETQADDALVKPSLPQKAEANLSSPAHGPERQPEDVAPITYAAGQPPDKSPAATHFNKPPLRQKPSTAPPAAAEQQGEATLGERVQQFFNNYQAAYKQRNILLFSHFFATDAVENGKPFASMVQTYLDLFEATDSASLEVKEVQWSETAEGVRATGRFHVHLEYLDGHVLSGDGPISFLLQEAEDSFEISLLDYQFEH